MQDLCTWDQPGADPYTGTPAVAISQMHSIPEPVRLALIERVKKFDSYEDVVYADTSSIWSAIGKPTSYSPYIYYMSSGKNKMCAIVTRSWKPEHLESGVVYCEQSTCIVHWSVCNNWSMISKQENKHVQTDEQATLATKSDGQAPIPTNPLESSNRDSASEYYSSSIEATPQTFLGAGFDYLRNQTTPEDWLPCACLEVPKCPLAPIPEPSTWATLIIGLITLWRTKCSKRSNSSALR